MIFATLTIDAVELRQAAVSTRHEGIAKEAPHLAQGKCKRLFTLCGFDFLRVYLVPVFELSIVTKQNILALLLSFFRVLLEVDQVLDVNQFSERVLLDLLLGHVRRSRFWRLRRILGVSSCAVGRFFLLRDWFIRLGLGNLAIDHAIFLKATFIFGSIFEGEDSLAVFEVFIPVTLVLASV